MDEKTPADFGRADVERDGWAPWTDSKRFSDELDTDDMADTAAAYLRASAEVTDVRDLSRRASELSADAGSLDGGTLVDADGRIAATERAVGEGDVADTVRLLVMTMNLAIDSEDDVRELVHGPGKLDDRFRQHLADARAEYRAARAEIASLNAELPPDGDPSPWVVTVNGYQFTAEVRGGAYVLAGDAVDGIRTRYLEAARKDATDTGLDVREAIEVYRRRLATTAAELDPYGFDLTGGPLALWTTPGMAEWAANGLRSHFAGSHDHPDLDAMLHLTEGLDAIVRSVHGTGGDPGEPVRPLTARERDFLLTFFRTLDEGQDGPTDMLSSFAADLPPLSDPGDAGRRTAVLQRMANGLMMLLDPATGGIDPRDPEQAERIPSAVRRFVYGDPPVAWAETPTTYDDQNTRWGDLHDLAGFGNLVGTAGVGPGEHLGRDMAEAAVRIQGELADFRFDWSANDLPTPSGTGPEGMLRAVSESPGVAAGLLADTAFRDGLLSRSWPEGVGPGLLIENGTTLPPGVEPGSAAARPYERAAGYVALGAERYFPDGREPAGTAGDRRLELALAGLPGRYGPRP